MTKNVFLVLCGIALAITIVGYMLGRGLEAPDDEDPTVVTPPELAPKPELPPPEPLAPDEQFLGRQQWVIGGTTVSFEPGGELTYGNGQRGSWIRKGNELMIYTSSAVGGRAVRMRGEKLFAGDQEILAPSGR